MTNIFSAVSPMLYVSKCIGLGPFHIDKEKKAFKVSTPGLIYSSVMLLLFTANSGFIMYTKVVFKNEKIESYIGLATGVILLACGVAVTICNILFGIVQRKKFISVVENFYAVSFEMGKLNEKIPYKNLLRNSLIQLSVLVLVLILLLTHSIFYVPRVNKLLYASYMYTWFGPKIYNFIMEFQFVSGALLLKIHFNLLNKCLEKFEEPIKSGKGKILNMGLNHNAWTENLETQMNNKLIVETFTVWEGQLSKYRPPKIWSSESSAIPGPLLLDKIKIIRKIHSNLCEIKEYLNTAYSLQLLTSVAQAFVYITANLYIIFTTLSTPAKTSAMELSHPIVWSITHATELVIIVVTCTNTSKTANYTAVLVHKLLAKDCSLELRNQLKLFSIQLLHRKISFTASGFFTLDMTLLQAIIGAATTYLVILIQFHNTYEVPHDK